MPMSYLQAFGLKASQVLPLTWGLLLISLAVIAVVSVLLVRGLFMSPKTTVDGPDSAPVERPVAGTSRITIGVGISAFVLFLSRYGPWRRWRRSAGRRRSRPLRSR